MTTTTATATTQINTISIDIPVDMAELVKNFVTKMQVKSKPDSNRKVAATDYSEVKRVMSHTVDQKGNYSFVLKFADNHTETVADADTDCDVVINKYLQEKGINTVYIVCRVSTKGQANPVFNVSLQAQEEEMQKYILYQRLNTTRVKVCNISESAYTGIPKTLQVIGSVIESGSSIIIYRVDRLSRNLIKYLEWLEELNKRGVDIYSVTDKMCYKTDKINFIQKIIEAQRESEMIGMRVKTAIEHKRQRGDYIGGAPFGYSLSRLETGQVIKVTNIIEQTALAMIRQYQNSTPQMIVEKLKKARLTNRAGKKWTTQSVAYHRKRL